MRALIVVALMAGVVAAQPAGSGSGKHVIDLPPELMAPEVRAAASPSEVQLGARFTVFVTAVHDKSVKVNLREPVDLGSAFEIRNKDGEDHERADGRIVREWQFDVYAWELGDLAVPPIAVTFTAGGKAAQVETDAVPIRVTGELGDIDDAKLMRGDAPPRVLASRDWLWVWIAGGIGLVAGGAIAYVWQRRRRRRVGALVGGVAAARPRRIDMTSTRALERLLSIERSGVLDRDDDRKSGYHEMAQVIREYLGARYGFVTVDLTTAELMRTLARAASDREIGLVEAWLDRCDLVKYGGFRASTAEAYAVLTDARGVIVATTEQPQREAA